MEHTVDQILQMHGYRDGTGPNGAALPQRYCEDASELLAKGGRR